MPIKNQQQKAQGKINPQKYVYQGSPPIMLWKTKKKNHPVKLEIPIKTRKKKEKQRQNRPSEIRLSGVPL